MTPGSGMLSGESESSNVSLHTNGRLSLGVLVVGHRAGQRQLEPKYELWNAEPTMETSMPKLIVKVRLVV